MTQEVNIKELNERIKQESEFVDLITMEIQKVIVGQKNLVERLEIMTPEKRIQAQDIPSPFNREPAAKEEFDLSLLGDTYKDAKVNFEKAFIAKKLREFNGNISQTSEAIGVERSNLHKKIKAYGLEKLRDQ